MEEIRCMCSQKGDCPMYINVNSDSGDGIILLEIEDVSVDPIKLINQMPKDISKGDLAQTRVPFALDMNGALTLIRKLQKAVIQQLRTIPDQY